MGPRPRMAAMDGELDFFVSSSDIEVSSEFFDPNIFLHVIWQDIIFSWKQKNSPYLNILVSWKSGSGAGSNGWCFHIPTPRRCMTYDSRESKMSKYFIMKYKIYEFREHK